MRILFSTPSAPHYMAPPILSDEQVNCGPFFPDLEIDGRVISLTTPCGEYDLSLIASRLPANQQPEAIVCMIDSSWFNVPRNFAAFKGPKVALIADTHHMTRPILGMINYLTAQKFDRHILLYTRHHHELFRAAGLRNLHWLPGLTFPHTDAMVAAARKAERAPRIAMIGQSSGLYRRRLAVAGAVARANLPVVFREGTQREALDFYGSSLLGLNVTANADLNLRTWEIAAAGSLLLQDRLSAESGLETLFKEDRDYIGYDGAGELVDRVRFFLEHPGEALRIGESAASTFDRHLNAERRRRLFDKIVADGADDPQFALPEASRFVRMPFGGHGPRLFSALSVYEHLQQLHANAEEVRIQVDETVPGDFAQMCNTLPRVTIRRDFAEQDQVDLLVASVTRVETVAARRVPRIWFWNAQPEQVAGIDDRLQASGYVMLKEGSAFFHLPSAVAEETGDRTAAEARVRLLNCDLAGAFDLARKVLQRDPGSVDAHLLIAEIALESGKRDLFEKMVARARELAPSDPNAALLIRSVASGETRRSLVDRMLATSMRHLPDHALTAGRAVAERATKIDAACAGAWHWLGSLAFRLASKQVGPARHEGREAALNALRRAVELAPHCAAYWSELGKALRQAGRADEAADAFERAAAGDPLDPANWIWLGETLLKEGRLDRAEALIEQGMKHVGTDRRLARLLSESRQPAPAVSAGVARQEGDSDMLTDCLLPIVEILNDSGVDHHTRSLRLAVKFDEIARSGVTLPPTPSRRVLMAYQPWFGVDMVRLTVECLEQGQLLVLFGEDRAGGGVFTDRITPGNFRHLEHRGVNLWTVCRYRCALLLRKMTGQIDPACEADRKVLETLYDLAATIVDKATTHLECFRPETVVFAQGHDLVSAVLRNLGIRRGLRVVSIENIFRKDRLLWEDVSGVSVNQNLSRNVYWRYRDFVSPDVVDGSVATYLEQVKGAKSGEHASPGTRLPTTGATDLPTITYLAQVSADSSVLFGLRGFESQVEVIATLARFAAARGMRLLVKLHPKENPAFKDAMTTVRGLTAEGLERHAGFQEARAQLAGRLMVDDSNRYDTYDLIRKANVCVTINSQAGLEAALHGKEVVLCGDAFYGALGFTHEVTDACSLEFSLDRVLRDGLRLNRGPEARTFYYVFTELYCRPKSVAAMRALLGGRPAFGDETMFSTLPGAPAAPSLQLSST